MQDPVQAALKETVEPGVMGIANGWMVSVFKKLLDLPI
jgi:hypothetical protein